MQNQEGAEPQNALAGAMRELEGMRSVNHTLRSAPQMDVPPMSDEEMIEDFRRTTGLIINSNGEIVGKDPNWVPPGEEGTAGASAAIEVPTAKADSAEAGTSPARPQAQTEVPMFGFRKKNPLAGGSLISLEQIKGIDLERGEVIIDNMRYPLMPEEIPNVARFCLQVMMRDLQGQVAELAKIYGADQPAQVPQEAKSETVQDVPTPAAADEVPPAPKDV